MDSPLTLTIVGIIVGVVIGLPSAIDCTLHLIERWRCKKDKRSDEPPDTKTKEE